MSQLIKSRRSVLTAAVFCIILLLAGFGVLSSWEVAAATPETGTFHLKKYVDVEQTSEATGQQEDSDNPSGSLYGKEVVPGVVYEIYQTHSLGNTGLIELENGPVAILDNGEPYKTDANGEINITGLPLGQYMFKEISAPEGIQVSNQEYFFALPYTVGNDPEQLYEIYVYPKNEWQETGSLSFTKVGDNGKDGLENVRFAVFHEDGSAVKDTDGNDLTVTTGLNGSATIEELLTGKYYLLETENPDTEYITDSTTKYWFEIYNEISGVKARAFYTDASMENKIKDADGKALEDGTIINYKKPSIYVSKVNTAGSELTGAILTIYEADAAGKATETIAKDKDGKELTWETTGSPQDITGIPAGTYILREEVVPRGYYVAYDILFTVNEDGTVTKDSATGDIDGNTIIMTDLKYGEVMPEWVALAIGKTVTGTAGDQDKEFTFTVELTYEDGEEVTEEFFYDGSKTGTIKSGESVKLKHGELIKIYNIPLDVEYTVTESDNEGYEVDPGKNAEGTIDEIGRNVQFTNHKDKSGSVDNNNDGKTPAVRPQTYSKGSTTTRNSTKTDDTTPLMLYSILLIAGMGIVGFLLYRKRGKA